MTEQERKELEVKLSSKERAYQPYLDNKKIIEDYKAQESEVNEE